MLFSSLLRIISEQLVYIKKKENTHFQEICEQTISVHYYLQELFFLYFFSPFILNNNNIELGMFFNDEIRNTTTTTTEIQLLFFLCLFNFNLTSVCWWNRWILFFHLRAAKWKWTATILRFLPSFSLFHNWISILRQRCSHEQFEGCCCLVKKEYFFAHFSFY